MKPIGPRIVTVAPWLAAAALGWFIVDKQRELLDEIDGVKSSIADLESKIDEAQGDLDGIQSDVRQSD